MKKFILVCFLFSFFEVFYAQKYQPIDSTLVWKTRNLQRVSSGFCCYVEHFASFQFHGFELNNGNTWLKLYKSNISTWVVCQNPCGTGTYGTPYTDAFFGYVMNDSLNKKVYFTPTLTANFTASTSNIVYDFLNKSIGDSLTWKSVDPQVGWPVVVKFQITNIDSLLFAGKYHKMYTVKNNTVLNYPISVIEGIGSMRGVWNSSFTDFESGSSVTCFSKPQQAMSVTSYTGFTTMATTFCATINTIPELESTIFSVHPNPVSSFIELNGIDAGSISIYDAVGKMVMEQKEVGTSVNIQSLPSGIYFLKVRSREKFYTSKFIKE